MKKFHLFSFLTFVSIFAVARPQLTELTDKPAIDYRVGETITFSFILSGVEDDTPPLFLCWTRTGDDGIYRSGFEPIKQDKPLKVKTKLERPGFVGLTVRLLDASGRQYIRPKNLGAGADVEKILPSYEEPVDFDAYWKGELEKLAKIPVVSQVTKVDPKYLSDKLPKGYDVYDLRIDCIGRPVTGRMVIPTNAVQGSLKAQVNFEGYGPGMQNGKVPAWCFQSDKIMVTINAHGYDMGKDDSYYKDFFKAHPNYGFSDTENADRDKTYFHDMALRVVRVFDYVKTLREWNGKDLIAAGGSQGGLQTTWAGSLVKGLTECKPHITWCCDLRGVEIGRRGGWRPDFQPGLAYYDAVFHTRRIPKTCRLEITRVGLGDGVCPPSGIAAQYNVANCEKSAAWYQNTTHMEVPENPEIVRKDAPAGCGKEGIDSSPKPKLRKVVPFVSSYFKTNEWRFAREGENPKAIPFSGRENLRTKHGENGGDLATMSNVSLMGTLIAEEKGYALIGVGADWWWELSVNGKKVFGRTRPVPGGNSKASFRADDWIFRVPVQRGENQICLDVCLGEHGFVAMEALEGGRFGEREISQKEYDDYLFFTKKYPIPEMNPSFRWSGKNGARVCKFETAQSYPAGIEWRENGSEAKDHKWKVVWDHDFDDDHKVVLPFEDGKPYEIRIVQHVLLDGWQIVRSKSFFHYFAGRELKAW